MKGYLVLIVIKGQWWSDQERLPTYHAALRHRKDVAAKWSDCDTAILLPSGEVSGFLDSLIERQEFAKLKESA